jgi:hypothetical protein
MFVSLPTVLRASAWLGFAAVVCLAVVYATTGAGQDPLQFVHPPDEYARLLLDNPAGLRATIGFDNVFIALYTTIFVVLGIMLIRAGAPRAVALLATGSLIVVGVLDMIENVHFLTMLAGAEQGSPPSAGEIAFTVNESLIKFHLSYIGLFLLAFALPMRTSAARWLARLLWFVQLPVGILIYLTPRAVSVPLGFVRIAFFLAAFVLIAAAFGRATRADAVSVPDAAGSDVRV